MSGTFKTLCVRTCDGAYFPVSFATVSARFQDDEKTCKALCPATEAGALRPSQSRRGHEPGGVAVSGQPYTALPTAFKFRVSHDPACSCKGAGQTWSDALKSVDDKAVLDQQGDIIVTEESAKKMQQQKMQAQQPKGAQQPAAGKKGAPAPATTAGTPPAAPAEAPKAADGKDKPIRSVGPTFIPEQQHDDAVSRDRAYSISSSEAMSIGCGTARPSVLAVCALMTSSNFVGRSTGRSSGLAPRKILPA